MKCALTSRLAPQGALQRRGGPAQALLAPHAAPARRPARLAPAPFQSLPSSSRLQGRPLVLPAAGKGDPGAGDSEQGAGAALGSVGLFLLWGGLAAYAFLASPNQTPTRDELFLKYVLGLGTDPTFHLNTIFTQLFFIMGVWPIVYTALLIPAGRSANGVPAWPFVIASYAVGAFGLLPFMALWQPPSPVPELPPAKEELQGLGNLMLKGMESPVPGAVAVLGAVACIGQAAAAGPEAWSEFFGLLQSSRFTHVMTLDFLTLTSLAPFWMANDAELRRWGGRNALLPVLSVIPVLGPAIYLCLRPRAEQ